MEMDLATTIMVSSTVVAMSGSMETGCIVLTSMNAVNTWGIVSQEIFAKFPVHIIVYLVTLFYSTTYITAPTKTAAITATKMLAAETTKVRSSVPVTLGSEAMVLTALTLMNVRKGPTIAIQMHLVITLMVLSFAPATMGSMEMVSIVTIRMNAC